MGVLLGWRRPSMLRGRWGLKAFLGRLVLNWRRALGRLSSLLLSRLGKLGGLKLGLGWCGLLALSERRLWDGLSGPLSSRLRGLGRLRGRCLPLVLNGRRVFGVP